MFRVVLCSRSGGSGRRAYLTRREAEALGDRCRLPAPARWPICHQSAAGGLSPRAAIQRAVAATLGGFLPGHEAGVILGGVDPAGRFGHHLQRDREASLQRTQLLEPLALFEGRWRQCRKPQ